MTDIPASEWLYYLWHGIDTSYAMLSSRIPWNMPHVTFKIVFSVYTREPLSECVYKENTSDKWHVTRYPSRMHCMAILSYA